MADNKSWRKKSSGVGKLVKTAGIVGAGVLSGPKQDMSAQPQPTQSQKIQQVQAQNQDRIKAPNVAPEENLADVQPARFAEPVDDGYERDNRASEARRALEKERQGSQPNKGDKPGQQIGKEFGKGVKDSVNKAVVEPAKAATQKLTQAAFTAARQALVAAARWIAAQAAAAWAWVTAFAIANPVTAAILGIIVIAFLLLGIILYFYPGQIPSPTGKTMASFINRSEGFANGVIYTTQERFGLSPGKGPKEGSHGVPLYNQRAYRDVPYCSPKTLSSSGCGIMAAAMVLQFYGKTVATPESLAHDALSNGFRVCGSNGPITNGTAHGFFPFIAKKYGLKNAHTPSWETAMSHLKKGHPVIVSGKGPLPFSSGGHYVVLTGYNSNGSISVNDSAHPSQPYSESHLRRYTHFIDVMYP